MWWETSKTEEGSKPNDSPFSVVQLRLDKQDQGEGRISNGLAVTTDKETGVALSDWDRQPTMLREVGRERERT